MFDDTTRHDRLLARHCDGDISRRTVLRALSAAGAAAGLVGGPLGLMTRDAWAEVKQIYVMMAGAAQWSKAEISAFLPFTKKTGIKVVSGSFGCDQEFCIKLSSI